MDADTPTCQPQRTAEREAETVALAAAKEKATLEAEATKAEATPDLGC